MTRWLLVHPSDEMYGADRVLLEILDALGKANVVGCWLPIDVPYPDHHLCRALGLSGVPARHLAMPVLRRRDLNPIGLARLSGRALRALPEVRRKPQLADAVYLSTSAVLPMAAMFKLAGYRVVQHIHEAWGTSERRLLGPLLRFCDTVIAGSQAVADRLPSPAPVLLNGFPDLPEPVPAASDDGPLQALIASRWSVWKGHTEFLQAWKRASLSNAHLTIVGAPPPAGGGVDVPGVVARLGLESTVTVLPEQNGVTDLLQRSHLVVVPSVKPDPLPTIAIDAARAGRAVLASDGGGLPEIVRDGASGWLVAPGDTAAWTDVLHQISCSEAAARGVVARQEFVERFSFDRFRRDLLTLAYPPGQKRG